MGAIMSRLRAGTCMSGSRWVQGNRRRTSTEVGMTHWARWSATVVDGITSTDSRWRRNNNVRAYALRTQKMMWEYTHKSDPDATACCGPNNRGVVVSGGSVFVGTLDDNLLALDATTGKVKWEVKV